MASPASVLLGPGDGGVASPSPAHSAISSSTKACPGRGAFSVATVPLAEGAPPVSAGYKLTRKGKTEKPHQVRGQAVSQHPERSGSRLNRRDKSRTGRGPEDPRDGAHDVSCSWSLRGPVEGGAGVPAPPRPKSDDRFLAPSVVHSSPLGAGAAETENAAPEVFDVPGVNAATEGLHVPAETGVTDGSDVPDERDMQDGLDVLTIDCETQPGHSHPEDPRKQGERRIDPNTAQSDDW